MSETHPMQAMVDGMSAMWQRGRAETQMTLGGLIAALEALPPERTVVGFGRPHSYRGYYEDLAFAPNSESRTVADLLATCRNCMGRAFEGYKGGEFVMGERTPLWISLWGMCSDDRLMALDTGNDPIRPVTAKEE